MAEDREAHGTGPEPDEREVFERLRQLLGSAELASLDKPLEGHVEELTPEQKRMLDLFDEMGMDANDRRQALSEADQELRDRLERLERRMEQAKTARDAHADRATRQMQEQGADARQLGIGLSIAYAILGLPLVGAGIGWLIDRATGVQGVWVGPLVLVGAAAGVAMAVFLLGKSNRTL